MGGVKFSKGRERFFSLALVASTAVIVIFAIVLSGSRASAEVITFPDEDLASESVLPVFDNAVSVKNKSITSAHRFEVGLLGGLSLAEPFYNPVSYGLNVSYHFTDEHGMIITGLMFLQGLSSNASNLNPIPNSGGLNANLQYAPAPKYFIMADYQYTGFYGKISLSKETVLRLHVYGLLGLDMLAIGDSANPGVEVGIGQKLYFTSNFALRTDFHFIAYQGPDVLSRDLHAITSQQSASSFSTTTLFVSLLSVGVSYLF